MDLKNKFERMAATLSNHSRIIIHKDVVFHRSGSIWLQDQKINVYSEFGSFAAYGNSPTIEALLTNGGTEQPVVYDRRDMMFVMMVGWPVESYEAFQQWQQRHVMAGKNPTIEMHVYRRWDPLNDHPKRDDPLFSEVDAYTNPLVQFCLAGELILTLNDQLDIIEVDKSKGNRDRETGRELIPNMSKLGQPLYPRDRNTPFGNLTY